MPLDFPSSPAIGTVWTGSNGCNYIWDGTKWYLQAIAPLPGPYVPVAGGTMGGPLYYTATGGTVSRSLQSRMGEQLSATDFGIICDGVTDQGAQLNAALASMAPGTTLYIPGSIYTTVTIQVLNGVRLRMPPGEDVRPGGGSNPVVGTTQIIGSASLSPVVYVFGNEGGLIDVWVTRNGTPVAGAIGVAVFGSNNLFTHLCSYNHARCVQVGAPASAPVLGQYSAIGIKFDHCRFTNATEDFVYLMNCPETTFYDCRWFYNGGTWPVSNSCVCIDGDNNTTTGAGTANTLTFLRCQFNQGSNASLYAIRFKSYASPDGFINFIGCYSDGATTALIYIDPSSLSVQHLNFTNNLLQIPATATLISDAAKTLRNLTLIGNHLANGPTAPTPSLYLSGISAVITSNCFLGAFAAQLDGMIGGCFSSNNINTLVLSGAFTGNFMCTGNAVGTVTNTATGPVNYLEPYGSYGQQIVLGKTGQAGRVDFRRGTDGQALAWIGVDGAAGAAVMRMANIGGSPIVAIDASNTGGVVSFRVNNAEVARADVNGLGISKVTGAAVAPGAGLAKLAFIAGTTAGTGKLVAYCGTSATPVTIVDNIGAGF